MKVSRQEQCLLVQKNDSYRYSNKFKQVNQKKVFNVKLTNVSSSSKNDLLQSLECEKRWKGRVSRHLVAHNGKIVSMGAPLNTMLMLLCKCFG